MKPIYQPTGRAGEYGDYAMLIMTKHGWHTTVNHAYRKGMRKKRKTND